MRYGFDSRLVRHFVLNSMYEPKFKLNKRDDARWHLLLTRHCAECPVKPGGKVRRSRKYPPLTPVEFAEFEALCAKRSQKIAAHPRVKESIAACNRSNRKLGRMLDKLLAYMAKLPKI